MTLDDLSTVTCATSTERVVRDFERLLTEWLADDADALTLEARIERFIGVTWVESDSHHATIDRVWSAFRDQRIRSIGGMTMNERIYFFSLGDRLESASCQDEIDLVYRKLLARP